MKPIEPCFDQELIEFEMQVINELGDLLNADTSDTQGILMAREDIDLAAYFKYYTPEETASLVAQILNDNR